jgi:SPP1 gp7 family putative phage head morphogenesis protein
MPDFPELPITFRPEPLPPKEAIAFWKDKVQVSKKEFESLSDAAKAKAFFVSGLAKGDMLAAVHASFAKTLAEGGTFASWQKDNANIFDTLGWTGKKRRLETIFRTNLQQAYMAGRYQQLQASKELRPYWQYSAVNDARTRPAHKALHGQVYPADHPFWDAWFPPNGFRCRCTVKSLSKRQVEARGLKVQDEIPDMIETEQGLMPLRSEPGFGRNAARDWLSGLSPVPLDGDLVDLATDAICRKGKGHAFADHDSGEPCKPPLATLDPRHILPVGADDILKKGLAPEDYVKAFLAEFGLANLDASKVVKIKGGVPVVINKGFFIDKRTGAWKVLKSGRERYVRLLARTILSPYEIWRVPATVAQKHFDVLRLIRLFDLGGKIGGYVAFNLIHGRVWQAATAFTPNVGKPDKKILDYLEKQRHGALIYRES